MKYISITAALMFIFFSKMAEAVVIVPPAIYIATFSMGTFILNAFIMISAYMAGRGLMDRFYFGKHMHELVGIAFSYIGSITVILSVSFVAIAVFDPIDSRTLFYASVFSAFLSFIILALNNFRKYLLSDPYARNESVMRLIIFSVIVFIITFVSSYFSINTSILKKSYPYAAAEDAEMKPLDLYSGLNFKSRDESAQSLKKNVPLAYMSSFEKIIWFNPYKNGVCEIYAEGKHIRSEEPLGKCFYYDSNNNAQRILCPIGLNVSDLKSLEIPKNREIQFEGRGSCLDHYKAYVTDNGVINIQ